MNLAGAGLVRAVGRRRCKESARSTVSLRGAWARDTRAATACLSRGARQQRSAHEAGPDRIALRRHVQPVELVDILRLAVLEHGRDDVDVVEVAALACSCPNC